MTKTKLITCLNLSLLLSSLVFLSSCQKRTRVKDTATPKIWQEVKEWSFIGKMAINDGHNSGSGKIKWLVTNNTIQAEFKAPLGQGSWKIIENKDFSTIISSRNGKFTGTDTEELIAQELGWDFPWNALKSWLRGTPSHTPAKDLKDTPLHFSDQGWNLEFTQSIQTSVGLLPKRIKASKPPYSVKLIIYRWDIH